MAHQFTLPEQAKIVSVLKPAADAAGRTGRAVSLKNAQKAFLVAFLDQGNAATVLLTPQQCTAVAGTGAKAINATRIWAALTAQTTDILVRQTDAVNYTTDVGLAEKIVVFEIDPAALDVAGGFDCVRLNTGASNAANITSAFAVLSPLRYSGDQMPSSLTD
jgi:hypothetical protein